MSSSRPTSSANRAIASSNRPSTSAASCATNPDLILLGTWAKDKDIPKNTNPKPKPASGQPVRTPIGNNSSMPPMLRAYVNQDPRSGPWSPAVMQGSDAGRWRLSFSSTTNLIPSCHRYPSSFYNKCCMYGGVVFDNLKEFFWFWTILSFSWDIWFQGLIVALWLWIFRAITRMGGKPTTPDRLVTTNKATYPIIGIFFSMSPPTQHFLSCSYSATGGDQ